MTDPSSTRQRILDQAIEVTVREGVHHLSMRKIASRVGLTPMAIYRHFKDKQELEQVLLGHAFDLFEAYLRGAQAGESAHERLTTLADGFFTFALERPQHFELLFLSAANPRQVMAGREVKDVSGPTYRLLHETVTDWIGTPREDDDALADATLDILAFCIGHAALHISGNMMGRSDAEFGRFQRAFASFLARYGQP